MSSFKTRFEIGLASLVCLIVLPYIAYIGARLYYLGLLDEVTFEKVPSADRWIFLGLGIVSSLGYGLGAWYGHNNDWILAELLALVSLLNGLPLIMALILLSFAKAEEVQVAK